MWHTNVINPKIHISVYFAELQEYVEFKQINIINVCPLINSEIYF